MEHLALEVFDLSGNGSQFANLPDDTSITIIRMSRVFDRGDIWSHAFTLNVMANLHIFGTAGEIHGSRIHEQINKRRARLWVEGLPLYYGYLRLDDEVDVDEDGNVDITFESGHKTFEELIDGGKANQVPLMSDVQFGLALWRKRWMKMDIALAAAAKTSQEGVAGVGKEIGYVTFECDGETEAMQQYPRMVYPTGTFYKEEDGEEVEETVDFLNTDYPYDDGHPYCNVALCYQKKGYPEDEKGKVDYNSEPEAKREYEYMPANRVNSAPNFYVIYWIRCLMAYLNIHIDENQMMDVEDMRRLFFVNTQCAYDEPEKLRTVPVTERYGRYTFSPSDDAAVTRYLAEQLPPLKCFVPEESSAQTDDYAATTISGSGDILTGILIGVMHIDARYADKDGNSYKIPYKQHNNYLHRAYATSACFPDEEISKVVEMLENAFGVRFVFDDEYQRVRILLLRNIFRDGAVQEIDCEVVGESKQENSVRGFRMTFGKGEADTAYFYRGFANLMPRMKELWADTSDTHDYSKWKLDAIYADIIQRISAFDKTCYVTPISGNAYGIKIDEDAKKFKEMYPSLFEFAGFMDAEDGDCTGEKDTVKEINVGFTPAIMNDLNMHAERGDGDNPPVQEQRFALFVDEEMEPRRDQSLPGLPAGKSYDDPDAVYDVDTLIKDKYPTKPGEFSISSDMFAIHNGDITINLEAIRFPNSGSTVAKWSVTIHKIEGHFCEGYRLYLQDNFDPNDQGVSPIETHQWGLCLGIMRGSGSDAYVNYQPDADDGEGNDTWDIMPGSSVTAHPDTCDDYGRLWDYNGCEKITTPAAAVAYMLAQWPDSNVMLERVSSSYIDKYCLIREKNDEGQIVSLLFASHVTNGIINYSYAELTRYSTLFYGMSAAEMYAYDAAHRRVLIEVGSSAERGDTLLQLQRMAYAGDTTPITIDDNGVGTRYGRFSLKLRNEKLNPDFDPSQSESAQNRRYLEINDPNLRGRGLMDTFHKEESYWTRSARIVNKRVLIGMAQLMGIDDTKRMHVGDVTGMMKKMQFTVNIKSGLSPVDLQLMYI